MPQAARNLLFALLVFASLLFTGTVLTILILMSALWCVSAFIRMLKARPVSVAEIEAELSRLARVNR
jgi:hypothetical protein